MAKVRLQGEKEKNLGVYYEIDTDQSPIGEGGMGKVFKGKAVDTSTGSVRDVAIKFMFMDLPEQAIERARREASVQLRNDNLVEMLGFIETDEERDGGIVKHYHVVSELLHGVSLLDLLNGQCTDNEGQEIPFARKMLNDFSKTPELFAKQVIKSVLSGLMALHDAGYIHRDIDPSNIMLTSDGHIKLIDFGICKQMHQLTTGDKALTVAGAFMGKPEYAAPELALGDLKHQNQTSDIYAVGILLYQCIVGHVPFEGTRFDVLDHQIKSPVDLSKIHDKQLKKIIRKACEKHQEKRYQTAAEMRVDLESMDVKRASSTNKTVIISAVVAALLIAAAVVLFIVNSHKSSQKEQELTEQMEVNTMMSDLNHNIENAEAAAAKGYKHGEGYDEELIEAMGFYSKADELMAELEEMGVSDLPDYSNQKFELETAIDSAIAELNEKIALFSNDPDPDIIEEVERFKERVAALEGSKSEK